MTTFGFKLLAEDGRARTGEIHTPRGIIRTPAFMPVGTVATVKAMLPSQVRETGADVLLGNTYHLMLRPGAERIARLGGLHTFMRWPHPILTDSGGYQVMSLGNLVTLTETGVTFASHLDGTRYELTPERAVEIQGLLGSDIQMQLDECTAFPATHEVAKRSLELSLRWADRSKAAFAPQAPLGRALFGIVQGSVYPDLREQSARALVAMDMHGYSVGGLAVGEPQAMMFEVLDATVPLLPREKPRYLMGVGKPGDILGAVERGIDMFDCVLPTRSGRHGQAFTRFGPLNLKNARHADDPSPIDPESDCPASRDYSRAYLHHLIRAGEILGAILVSWSNLAYYQALMADVRAAIAAGRLTERAAEIRAAWAGGDRDKDDSD